MINNTALSAKIGHVQFAEQIAKNVTFIDEEYKKFFLKYLKSEDIQMSTMRNWCIAWGLKQTQRILDYKWKCRGSPQGV